MLEFHPNFETLYEYQCDGVIGIGIGFGIGIEFEVNRPVSIPIPIAIPTPSIYGTYLLDTVLC